MVSYDYQWLKIFKNLLRNHNHQNAQKDIDLIQNLRVVFPNNVIHTILMVGGIVVVIIDQTVAMVMAMVMAMETVMVAMVMAMVEMAVATVVATVAVVTEEEVEENEIL